MFRSIWLVLVCGVSVFSFLPADSTERGRTFEVDYKANIFRKDGAEFRYVSGELHYFRIPRAYWKDRLRKSRYAGLNAITTYVEWSSHESTPNMYDFTGENDIVHFIRLAQAEGLLVLLRPGPYICAERSLGGLPPWLMTLNPYMRLRTTDASYLHYVERWFKVLFTEISPLLYGNGGPIIMVQVENEYGSYFACDSWYMRWLTDTLKGYVEKNAVLYTTDGAGEGYFKCGPTPGVLATVDFGPSKSANTDPYRATTTSYDYDAPITEAGDLTAKYYAIRDTLKEFADPYNLDFGETHHKAPTNSTKKKYGRIKLSSIASIFEAPNIWDKGPLYEENPLNFETLGTYTGFVLYETEIPDELPDPPVLSLPKFRDRATVYVDEEPRAILDRMEQISTTPLWTYDGKKLSILVENQAYVNYDSELQGDFKGLLSIPTLGGKQLLGWNMTTISLSDIRLLYDMQPSRVTVEPPAFYEANFYLPGENGSQPADTFLDPSGWGKGIVFLNGFNLGRYWPKAGPQVTLYVPGCYLKAPPGLNKLIVFEQEQIPVNLEMRFLDTPKFKRPSEYYTAFYLKDEQKDHNGSDVPAFVG
ncbi:beta-galactosidase isoform X2 [Bemisia tabaci]|uniref:beta-galactosidase isoform X2 n=1 Tax=Bemisia tabaci TaxID=7038 RepID=UPI003B27D700